MQFTSITNNLVKLVVLLFVVIFLVVGFFPGAYCQSSKSLDAKRKKLEKEIAYTNKLLKETRKNKKNTLYELQLLQNKINNRNELIAVLKANIAELDKKIALTQSSLTLNEKKLKKLKEDYAKILTFLARYNNDIDRLTFIFSAEDINQAYQRIRYMDEMLDYIRRQADTIQNIEKLQKKNLSELTNQKEKKQQLLEKENIQLKKIEKNKIEKNRLNSNLIKKEKELRRRLSVKQKEASKLNKKIKDIIVKETAKKKAPATKKKTPTANPKVASDDFYRNKGKLPWPVDNGFISERFGSHPHPVLKHVLVNNNGINIATSSGSVAKAVFKGKVVSVANISNTNKVVILKHGNWFTVYSNLDEIFVKTGDLVNAGDALGKVHTNLKGRTELHFEIWNGKRKQNPAYWIRK